MGTERLMFKIDERMLRTGKDLELVCEGIAESLGLKVQRRVYVGRRVYGPRREIDLVITDTTARKSLGVECKLQRSKGTAEEKIPSTIEDIAAWPIPGLVCFAGEGFSEHLVYYMYSTGKAVHVTELEEWLRLYFVL